MHLLIKFSHDIGLEPIEKDVSATETVENLEVLISLNYDQMNSCKLIYNNQNISKNKELKLLEALKSKGSAQSQVFDIHVVKKGQLDEVLEICNKIGSLAQGNPIVLAGLAVIAIFVILAVLGSVSGG